MRWEKVALGDVVTFRGGGTPRKDVPEYWGTDIPWATVKDFKSLTISSTVDSISRKGLESSASNLIPAGHVIIPTRMALGKAAINTIDVAINQDLRALIPRVEIDPVYLLHSLLGLAKTIERNGSGATVKGITQDKLGALQIPLPPLAEQKRIARILDQADALRAKRRETIKQLDALVQSVFLDMFGDPVTNPKGWEIVDLQDMGLLDRGVSKHRPRNDLMLLGGPYPLIQTGDVARSGGYIETYEATYSEAGLSQSRIWPAGTLCITIAANIANTGILGFDACFPDSVVGFKPADNTTVEFIQVLLSFLRLILERQAPQVAQRNINLRILRQLPVPRPPSDLVQEFTTVVKNTRTLRERASVYLDESDRLFDSIQSRAFKGEL